MLRGKPSANADDVELYLKKHEHLTVSINKLDPRNIRGEYAEVYLRICIDFKDAFTKKYPVYIPYLVFIKSVCELVLICIEEKTQEDSIDEFVHKIQDNQEVTVQIDYQVENLKYYKDLEGELVNDREVESNVSR